MVRLRLSFSTEDKELYRKFTIHYGEIKTAKNTPRSIFRVLFTIHYGEIKTDFAKGGIYITARFTIHYGEIKTTKRARKRTHHRHLQSTMVRLRHSAVTGA